METLYAIMETLLPFEWLSYTFMKNALLAMLLISPLFGLLGTMAVDNKMAFFSDALGHSALTGIAIGVVLGWENQMAAMLLFGILWAVLITFVKHHSKMSADTIISVFSSTSIALGLVVLSRGGTFAKYSSVLVGDVLSITQSDLWLMGMLTALTFLFFNRCLDAIILVAYDRDFARTQRLPVRTLETVMTALMALTIVGSLHMVGIVLVVSLLSVPQMTAALFARTFRGILLLSALIGYAGCLGGLWLSYAANVPSGAAIILCAIAIYFLARAIKWLQKRFS